MTADGNNTLIGILLVAFGGLGFVLALGFNLLEFMFNMGFTSLAPIVIGNGGVSATQKMEINGSMLVEQFTPEVEEM